MSVEERRHRVGTIEPLALTRQCELAGVARSAVYAARTAAKLDEPELIIAGTD